MSESPFSAGEHLEHAIADANEARNQMDIDTRSFGHLEAAIAQLRTTKALLDGDEKHTLINKQ